MIHKSHSKKEIIDIIKTFNINISNIEKYNKNQLTILLEKELLLLNEIKPNVDKYLIYNLIDLIQRKYYLSKIKIKLFSIVKRFNITA